MAIRPIDDFLKQQWKAHGCEIRSSTCQQKITVSLEMCNYLSEWGQNKDFSNKRGLKKIFHLDAAIESSRKRCSSERRKLIPEVRGEWNKQQWGKVYVWVNLNKPCM